MYQAMRKRAYKRGRRVKELGLSGTEPVYFETTLQYARMLLGDVVTMRLMASESKSAKLTSASPKSNLLILRTCKPHR
jgi:hypothetical protein